VHALAPRFLIRVATDSPAAACEASGVRDTIDLSTS
jgi:hypothetical protein